MAEADIAYVATAGAAGLALGVSAWALRLRARLSAAAAAAERDRDAAQADLSRHDSMLRGARLIRLRAGQSGFESWLRLADSSVVRQTAA